MLLLKLLFLGCIITEPGSWAWEGNMTGGIVSTIGLLVWYAVFYLINREEITITWLDIMWAFVTYCAFIWVAALWR
jgi:hypothetical protein